MRSRKFINYPKKTKTIEKKICSLEEPVRKTIYDVIKENFEYAERTTFLHRLIIVGKHSFGKANEKIIEIFGDSVRQANSKFHYERITGILLNYRKYFVHMVEGDEDVIYRQLGCLSQHPLYSQLTDIKIVMYIPHINDRFFPEWINYHGQPRKLLGKIMRDCSVQECGRLLYSFMKKFYSFILHYYSDIYFANVSFSDSMKSQDTSSLSTVSAISASMRTTSRLSPSYSSLVSSSIVASSKDTYKTNLPENELIDFILQNKNFETFESFYSRYGIVCKKVIYKDHVWPVPSDLVPYDIFPNRWNFVMELNEGRVDRSDKLADDLPM